jgi:quercetin dioxygenase-like cupin family protein
MLPPRLLNPGDAPVYRVVGDAYTVLAGGAQTGGAYALFDGLVPPGHGTPPHTHRREDETFYILDGKMTFFVAGKALTAGPGAYVYAPRDVQHHFQNQTDAPVRMLILATPAGIEQFFAAVSQGEADAAAPPTSQYLQNLVTTAAQFGIEIPPPP